MHSLVLKQQFMAGLLVLSVLVGVTSLSTASAENQAFLSVYSPIIGQTIQQSYSAAPTLAYIQKQVVAYDVRLEQLLSMPLYLQREILSMDGTQRPLTREERHSLVPFRSVVPTEVQQSVIHSNRVSEGTLSLYGVTIPNSVSQLPEGFKCVLLGNRLLFLNASNTVLSSVAL
jgi:hypothetical protein